MAVVFQAAAEFGATTTQSCVLTRPAGVAAGDLMVVAHISDGAGSLGAMTAPTASGAAWTLSASRTLTISSQTYGFMKVWTRVATGSETSTYTFADGTGSDASAGLVVFRDWDTTTPFNAAVAFQDQTSATAPNGTQHTAPSVTGVDGGVLLTVHAATGRADPNTFRSYTAPSGMTERVDANDGSPGYAGWVALAMFTQSLTSNAATGDRTAVCSANRQAICASVVVRPVVVETSIEPGRRLLLAT